MQVLITGATGLIGSEIVRLCLERNIAVNYLTTRKSKIVSKENYHGFYWNPDSGEIDLNCFKNVTAIINLAGASISKRWTPKYKKTIRDSRINALRTLKKGIDKIENSKIKSFVSASAIGIYPSSLSEFYTESEDTGDKSFLSEITVAWEKETNTFETFDVKVSRIRIGLVLSADGGALTEMAKPISYFVGAAFGKGTQWQSWIHIKDLARQFLFVIENNLDGVYNGVAPNPISNGKLVKAIAEVLNKPLLLPNIPKFIMQAILGEMSNLVFASQRVSSKKIEEHGFVFNHPNISSALENIYSKASYETEFDDTSKKD